MIESLKAEVARLRRREDDIRAREAEIRAREPELRQQLEREQRQLEATEQTITTELRTLQEARDEAKAKQGEFLCSCRQPHPPSSPPPSHTRANTRKHTLCTRPRRSHVLLFPLRPLPLDREQEACARAEGRCDISSLCSNHVARAFMTAQQPATRSLAHPLTALFLCFLLACVWLLDSGIALGTVHYAGHPHPQFEEQSSSTLMKAFVRACCPLQ